MKKAIFFFAFFLTVGIVSADAQCSKSAAASAGPSCCSSKAAKAASADASIEKRQAEDGSISYVRKEADAQGSVKFVSVQYDEAANAFVNAAPKGAAAGVATEGMTKKSCTASEKKACAGSAAGASKACCAKPANGAACDKKAQ
ncbi:MAG: hypothetical protein Q7U74_07885 [Saprospiraceae bacterium]|nr:hypothetical protein [Saprospiraceae bacterium]